jgi:tetratricopeptide (TPR) repeat protein
LEIDRKLGNKSSMASALNNMGLVFWSRHQYVQALKHFEDSLAVYRELDNKFWIARSLNNIGATLLNLGEYSKAADYILQSLDINEKIENEKESTNNLENLGEIFQKMGDYENAIKYNEKGLELAQRIGLVQRVGYLLRNMGLVHLELGDYSKAQLLLNEAKNAAAEIDDKELQISVEVNLSKCHLFLNDAPKAEQCWEEAARTTSNINDELSSICILQIESQLKKRKREFDRALSLLEDALALAKKLNVGEEIFSLTLELAEIFLEKGDIEKSSIYLKRAGDFGLERYILFQPSFYLISGKIKWVNGDLKSAQKDFENALNLAENIKNPEMIWKVHHQLSKLLILNRDIENAYRGLKNAVGILKKLSETIEDDGLKRKYLEDPEKKELLSDLRKVAKDLVGETKTA